MSDSSFMLGRVISHYRIVETIGEHEGESFITMEYFDWLLAARNCFYI